MPDNSSQPASSGERVRHEIERLVDTVWASGERALDALGISGIACKLSMPRIDVIESPDAVEVLADVPGIDPQTISISLTGNMLTIEATRPQREGQEGETVHTCERPCGSFSRSIPLPTPVDPDSVRAESQHGVLSIQLAKPESAKPRQVEIKVKLAASKKRSPAAEVQ